MATMAPDRAIPAPPVDPVTRPFWDAAREGRFLIGLCRDTGRHFFYPRGVSPFTLSTNVELVAAKGTGRIYSYTVMRTREPYALAYVELEEGPRLMTNLVGIDDDAIECDMPVEAVFEDATPEFSLPKFRPVQR